jgi:flagellar basal-body rod protein FlgC
MFNALAIASSGLSAQRFRMELIAQNLANAETTRTPEGGPYRRKVVNLEAIKPQSAGTAASAVTEAKDATQTALAAATTSATTQPSATDDATNDLAGGVRIAGVTEDKSDGPMVYDPAHPDADKNGYVRMPNVNMTDELMDLMNARRLYEANATVFQVARAMLHKAIDI